MKNKNTGWNLDNSYTHLPDIFYKVVEPNRVTSPEVVLINSSLSSDLGLDADKLRNKDNIEILAGNEVPEDSTLIAQAYGGHQFGHFTMLGDGRAMLLGEQVTPEGERFDIQLKGSGRTPFSRGGDGRATLSSMLREYLISEAIHYLGIPSSRSLAVLKTGDKVYREKPQKGAVLTRVASSHIRIGTFQYAMAFGSLDDVKKLADYSIDRHFPDIKDDPNPYLSLLEKVTGVQASLIAKWKLIGFIHGVMNTDNMTVSGETIDYGPCAFMDIYDPNTVFSSIDRQGRYSYGNQSSIGEWNLARFAETLLALIDEDKERAIEIAEDTLRNFSLLYQKHWAKGMRGKLGLVEQEPGDMELTMMVMEYIEGREFSVGILGNGREVETLPILEVDFSDLPSKLEKIYSFEVKGEYEKFINYVVPAKIDEYTEKIIRNAALASYDALSLRDYARVDIRVKNGKAYVFDVNSLPGLDKNRSNICFMAYKDNMEYSDLIKKIVSIARKRYNI